MVKQELILIGQHIAGKKFNPRTMHLRIAVGLVSLFMSACISERCPPDDYVGRFSISDSSKTLLPYEDVTALVFENKMAKEIKLHATKPLIDSFYRSCLYKPCAVSLVDETCQNAERETRSITFEGDSIRMVLKADLVLQDSRQLELDTSFIEIIGFNLFEKEATAYSLRFLSNPRAYTLDSATARRFSADYLNEVTLLNRSYTAVYTRDSLTWFSEGIGLVGFRWNNEIYELVEVIN
jgi:hypothetical protein